VAAARRPGVGSELDEALVRAGRHLRRGVVSADTRTLENAGGRDADRFYRDRWSYDKVSAPTGIRPGAPTITGMATIRACWKLVSPSACLKCVPSGDSSAQAQRSARTRPRPCPA
jgi:hypothetical protein